MAFPIILVNYNDGSDSQASGAGPQTAIYGTAASTSSDGVTVTLATDNPDLSGIVTDGSYVIFLYDNTAGHRNFASIIGADNTAKTITVKEAFTGNLSGKSWAIGGKRVSIGSATSRLLFNNNSAAGDAMPGWTVEMESGHVETIASVIKFYRSGTDDLGPISLIGSDDAVTMPIITVTGTSVTAFSHNNVDRIKLANFTIINGGTASNNYGIQGRYRWFIENIQIGSTGSDYFHIGISAQDCSIINNCNVYGSTSLGRGIYLAAKEGLVQNSYIHNCLGTAYEGGGSYYNVNLIGNIFYNNPTSILLTSTQTGTLTPAGSIISNTIHSGNVGIDIASTSSQYCGHNNLLILNNNITSQSICAIKISNANAPSVSQLKNEFVRIDYNNFGNASDSTSNGTTITNGYSSLLGSSLYLPCNYTNASNGDFSVGSAIRNMGYPKSYIGYSNTLSYIDIGAAQSQADLPSVYNVYNDTVNGVAGTLTIPSVSGVAEGVTYGPNGTMFTGVFISPSTSEVEKDVLFGPSGLWVGLLQASYGVTNNCITYFTLKDNSTHQLKSDINVTSLYMRYVKDYSNISQSINPSSLTSYNSAWSSNAAYNVGYGIYRLDWPQDAFDGPVNSKVNLIVSSANIDTETKEITITPTVNIAKVNGVNIDSSLSQFGVNVVKWDGTDVAEPNTPGLPVVEAQNVSLDASFPLNFSSLNINSDGQVTIVPNQSVNISKINNQDINTSLAQIGVNVVKVSNEIVTQTSVVDANIVNVGGTVLSTSLAQIGVNVVSQSNIGFTVAQQSSLDDIDVTIPSIVNANLVKIGGSNVSTSTAQLGVNIVTQSNIDFTESQQTRLSGLFSSVTLEESTLNNIADTILKREFSDVTEESGIKRNTINALRKLINSMSVSGNKIIIHKEDGSTAFEQTYTAGGVETNE